MLIIVIFVIVFHRTRSASLRGTSWSSRCSARSPGPGGTVLSSGACRWRQRPRTGLAPWPRGDTGPGKRTGTARKSRSPVKAGWSDIFVAPYRFGPNPKPDFRVGSGRSGTGLGTGSGFSNSWGWRSCSILLIQKTHLSLSTSVCSGDPSGGPLLKHLWTKSHVTPEILRLVSHCKKWETQNNASPTFISAFSPILLISSISYCAHLHTNVKLKK